MRLVWVVIPLVLIGIISIQNADATSLSSPFSANLTIDNPPNLASCAPGMTSKFLGNTQELVIAIIEVNDIKPKTLESSFFFDQFPNIVEIQFSIDEIVYSTGDFSLEVDSKTVSNYEFSVGDKFGIYYTKNSKDDKKWIAHFGGGTCSKILTLNVKDYVHFYLDLKNHPCDNDKNYLIKISNNKKVCVTPETQEKLVDRGYGYYVGNLSFTHWEIVQNQLTFNSPDPGCFYGTYKIRNQCLPNPSE